MDGGSWAYVSLPSSHFVVFISILEKNRETLVKSGWHYPYLAGASPERWKYCMPKTFYQKIQTTLEGFRSLFSLLNSLFILLGLPWFRYLPQRFSAIIKSRYWPIIIGIPFGFALSSNAYKNALRSSDGFD